VIYGNDIDLSRSKNAMEAIKSSVAIEVFFALDDGICITKEGDVSYKAGDAIMTGTEGERWPIERSKFDTSYEPIAPTKQGENGLYNKKPIAVYALQMDKPFYVTVSWAEDRLEGQPGDWLLQYGENDYGIVSQSIFEKTYEIS